MIGDKKILTLITARGGSKGVPGKNIKPLLGKPLISWTIEAAKKSKYVDAIVVSTDSEAIQKVSLEYGVRVPFLRPEELSHDTAKQEDAILHAMQWMENHGEHYDYIMVLVPTTPLRDAQEIDAVCEFLRNHRKAKQVFTVSECGHHPLRANILPSDYCLENFVAEDLKFKNRQELPKYYQLSGSVCLSDWAYFKEEKSFLGSMSYGHITDDCNGLDIDSLSDFFLAEVLMKERLKSNSSQI